MRKRVVCKKDRRKFEILHLSPSVTDGANVLLSWTCIFWLRLFFIPALRCLYEDHRFWPHPQHCISRVGLKLSLSTTEA